MAKTVEFKVELLDGKVWGYVSPAGSDPSDAPIHDLLRWVLEQLNLGNWQWSEDSTGRASSLILGLAAAADATDTSIEGTAAQVESRLRSVNFAGLFARAREEGISARSSELADTIRLTATDAAYENTEIHYAFELLDILARIRKSTFVFDSPAIHGKVAPAVITLLREATRAYLFDLRRSCVSLCRALLEEALRGRVRPAELLKERLESRKGELECLINICERRKVLSSGLAAQAHAIRKAGNNALHSKGAADEGAWAVLQDTRAIITAICA